MQSCFSCFFIHQECMTTSGQWSFYVQKAQDLSKAQDHFFCFAPFELHRQSQLYKRGLTGPDTHMPNLAEPWHQWYSQMHQKVPPMPMSMSAWVEASRLASPLECFAVLACHLTGWYFLIGPAPVLIDVWVCKHYWHPKPDGPHTKQSSQTKHRQIQHAVGELHVGWFLPTQKYA